MSTTAAVEHVRTLDPARVTVDVGNRNPYDVAAEVAEHVTAQNDPPRLFAMGAAAVLLRDDGRLLALDEDHGAGWLAYIAERINFQVNTKDTPRLISPPPAVMKMLPPILRELLPPLDGVVTAPYLAPDGTVVAADGYNEASRLVLRMGELKLPAVSDKPSRAEVAEAIRLLSEEWLGDFPFESAADRACAIAELLTVLGRQCFPLAPMFVNDASSAGSGKGLLTTTLSLIATGEPPHFMELPASGEEQRKTITAALLEGRSVIAWDESHVIQGRSLAMILTAEVYSGRLLGSSKMISVRNKFTQLALGNNVEVRGDCKRRVMPCRIVPAEERPELRTGFRHADLPRWIRQNRGALLWAALTLWRNWTATGRPSGKLTMGSYEHWARVIGGVLLAAGITDFGGNTAEWLSYSEDDDGWSAHFAQLRQRYGQRWFTAVEVAEAVEAGFLKRPPIKRDDSRELAAQIGYAYRGLREQKKAGIRLVPSSSRNGPTGSRTWSVRKSGDENAPFEETGESSSVSSVSSVFPAQSMSEALTIATDDEPIVSSQHEPSSVIVSHRQYDAQHSAAGQSVFTDDTDDTDDENRTSQNETETQEPPRVGASLRAVSDGHSTPRNRSEDDWASLLKDGPGPRPATAARRQPKHSSRAARRRAG